MTSSNTEQRLARMRAVWAETAPDSLDVMRAKRRYARRSQQNGSTRLVWDLALGASFAGATLLAYQLYLDGSRVLVEVARGELGETATSEGPQVAVAERVASGIAAPSHEPLGVAAASGQSASAGPTSAEQPASAGGAPSELVYIERAGERVLLEPGVQYQIAQGEHITLVLAGQRQEIRGPKVLQVTLEADRAAGFRVHLSERAERPSVAAPGPVRGTGQSAISRESADSNDAWMRAAEALRRGDTAAAEAALERLSQSPRTATRQAAELALAQLWFSGGQRQRAKPLLVRLAEQAEAPVVRRRARELLAEL